MSYQGICECSPPLRGPSREQEDARIWDRNRDYKGVLHYLLADADGILKDAEHSLVLLWQHFNDSPV